MKGKTFCLLNGTKKGWVWRIRTRILENGTFHFKGCFDFQNNQENYFKHTKKYAQTHKMETNEKSKRWKKAHSEQMKTIKKKWNEANPEKVKEMYQRKWNKRKRGLGFIPINKPFEDAHGHHLDSHFVMYIPKELHQSKKHNVWGGEGMNEMNDLAMEWGRENLWRDN